MSQSCDDLDFAVEQLMAHSAPSFDLKQILLPIQPTIRATLKGSASPVSALTVLPDGTLASGCYDNTIKRWDLNSKTCIATLDEHEQSILDLAVLPDGTLATSAYDNTIKRWDLKTNSCIATLRGHSSSVIVLTVLPDGTLASGSSDKTMKRWDLNFNACVATLDGHSNWVNALTVLPDGNLASGSRDCTIKCWDLNSNSCITTLCGHVSWVLALAVWPDGTLVSGSGDHTIRRWDLRFKSCVAILNGHSDAIEALTVLPDGSLVSASRDKTIKRWNLNSNSCIATFNGHSSYVFALTVLPDGSLVSGSHDRSIYLWDSGGVTPQNICRLIEALMHNVVITDLNLSVLPLHHPLLIQALADLIKQNQAITRINCAYTGLIDDDVRALLPAIAASQVLCELNLTGNLISDDLLWQVEVSLSQARLISGQGPSISVTHALELEFQQTGSAKITTALTELPLSQQAMTAASAVEVERLQNLQALSSLQMCENEPSAHEKNFQALQLGSLPLVNYINPMVELLHVWKGKFNLPDNATQMSFEPIAMKPASSYLGAIYLKLPTKPGTPLEKAKIWLGKPGFAESGLEVTQQSYQLTKIVRGNIDVVAEKIAADTYHAANAGFYQLPKHRLGFFPVMHEFLEAGHRMIAKCVLLVINHRREQPITHTVHIFSKTVVGYANLATFVTRIQGRTIPILECILSVHRLPETVLVDGMDVPVVGLMEILAVARLIADTNVLGNRLSNVGLVVHRDQGGKPIFAVVVKTEFGFAFNFKGCENKVYQTRLALSKPENYPDASRKELLRDLKDIQFGNNQVSIEWRWLSQTQQCDYLAALFRAHSIFEAGTMIEFLLRRDGAFNCQGANLIRETTIQTIAKLWRFNLHIQTTKIYGEVNQALQPLINARCSEKESQVHAWKRRMQGFAATQITTEIPVHFICPITRQIMQNPVILLSGQSYEKAAIIEWIKQYGTDPMTREVVKVEQLFPNHQLKEAIEAFKAQTSNVNQHQHQHQHQHAAPAATI